MAGNGRPRPEDPAREVDEELAYHLESRVAELRKEGLDPDAAERRALQEFGDVEATRRYCAREDRRRLRVGSTVAWLVALKEDALLAARTLVRRPRGVLVPGLILAVGIALNAVVFSVVRGVLLAPLPFHDSDRMMVAAESGNVLGAASYPVLAAWRRNATGAEAVAGHLRDESVLEVGGEPRHVPVALVTEGYLGLLDRPILLGRDLAAADHAPGAAHRALISEGLWRSAFGADPAVLERTIRLRGVEHAVAGVVRGGAGFPDDVDAWLALESANPGLMEIAGAKIVTTLVRARPGVEPDTLARELSALTTAVPGGADEAAVAPLREHMFGDVRGPLLLLQGAVLLVLLAACANAGGLLLARATTRRADHAVRTSLGAGASRVARTVVAEGALVGIGAGIAGAALARVALAPTLALLPAGLPRAGQVALDGTVVGVALALALATGVGTALAPALAGMRADPASLLRSSRGEAGTGRWLRRVLDGFVVGQIALAFLLTMGAALLLRSFVATVREDPGFDPAGVTVLDLSLPENRYPDEASRRAFQRTLLERASGLPGSSGVALGVNLPISGSSMTSPLMVDGSAEPTAATQIAAVTSGFFEVLSIPMAEGAPDPEWDLDGARPVIMTDATLRTAEGRPLSTGDRAHSFFGPAPDGGSRMREVVGIVEPIRHRGLRESPVPVAWEPFFQREPPPGFSLLVRSTAPPGTVARAAQRLVHDLDSGIATDRIATMSARLGRSVAEPRFYTLGLTVFGGLALLLALAGCQAGLAYRVATRRRELGLRMALGASSPAVRALVVRRGLALAAAGAALGGLASLAATRVLESQLYGVSRHDPATYGWLLGVILVAAALASDGPARRAASVDPALTLREE